MNMLDQPGREERPSPRPWPRLNLWEDSTLDRRNALKFMAGGAVGGMTLMESKEAWAQAAADAPDVTEGALDQVTRGLPDLTITDIKVIQSSWGGGRRVNNHTVVKVFTSEPGLYGVGDGCNSQRPEVIKTYIEEYIKPFAVGRSVTDIHKLWEELWVGPYWRASVDHNNAISALDGALWDIMGKRAGQPCYNLFGGKIRDGNRAYTSGSGSTPEERLEDIQRKVDIGFRHFRQRPFEFPEGSGWDEGLYGNEAAYTSALVDTFGQMRDKIGWDIDIGCDVHSGLTPQGALVTAKAVEEFRPWFMEDLFTIEDHNWYEILRGQSAIGIATGELMVNNNEWIELVANRWVDYLRPHISAMGGPTLVKKLAHCAEFFGVMTSMHGPSNVSPVGHAINLHIELTIPNFGIGEGGEFDEDEQAAYPGCPVMDGGVRYAANDKPGWGIDIDEEVLANFPLDTDQVPMRTRYDVDGAPRNP